MNHYLFKYATRKAREHFVGRRVTSVCLHSPTLFSIGFQKCDYFLFVDLSPQNSFFLPFRKTIEKKDRDDLPFLFFLKRKLVGLKLVDVIQKGSERVVTLVFEDQRGSIVNRYKLILEIMDRNTNAIFTDSDDVVIQAFKHVESSRNILPKKMYEPLINSMPDLLTSDMDLLLKKFRYNEDILGFSTALRRLVSTDEEFLGLVKKIRETFEKGKFELYLYPKNVVLPFYFQKAFRSVDEDFLFEQYVVKPRIREIENRKRNILKILKTRLNSLKRRLIKVEDELKKAQNYDKYRIYAENLMANPQVDTKYQENVELIDVYTQKPIVVPLNPELTLFENAQHYFKKYKKAKKSVELVKKRIDETNKEINFIEQLIFDVESSSRDEDLDDILNILIQEKIIRSTQRMRRVKNYVPYEKLEIEGFDAYLGKNARGNDIVTLKLSSKNDLWFHAKNRPSSHLILKLPSKLKTLDDSVIIKAAEVVAQRSKANCGEKVDVDYAFVKDVKKPKGLKPGMVYYKNFKTVTVEKGECN